MKNWRDHYCDGIITYSQALGYGVRVMFFASIVFAAYNVVYFNILEPESVEKSLDIVEEQFYSLGYSEERIQDSVAMARSLQTPFFQAFSSILSTTFLGLMVSLIVAVFVRREGDPYQTAMRDIEPDEKNLNE